MLSKNRVLALYAVLLTAACFWALASGVAKAEAERPKNPFDGRTELVEEGRSLFNQYCSHCHGPNAVQGERPRDLRRLILRYEGNAPAVYYETVNKGRMEKGMPIWNGVLSDEVIWQIYTYLQTVQTEP